MSRAQATTWWDEVDDLPSGPVWIVPSRPQPVRARERERAASGSRRQGPRTARLAPEPQGFEERMAARLGDRPDRIALWAPMLGFFLMAVAAASAHV